MMNFDDQLDVESEGRIDSLKLRTPLRMVAWRMIFLVRILHFILSVTEGL